MHLFLQPDSTPQAPKRDLEEDDLGELPPLDGGGDDEAEPPPEELEDAGSEEETGDPFDDATGEGEPIEEIAAEGEGAGEGAGWLDDAGDADELDVGPHDLDEDERGGLLDDADEPGYEAAGDDEFDLKDVAEALTVDAGEEGFESEDEELREEDLPRLDADEDGEGGDEDFADAWPSMAEEQRPPWDDRAWERATELPHVGLARRVMPIEGGAIVVGGMLLRVEARGAIPFAGRGIHGGAIVVAARLSDARAADLSGPTLVVATERGGLFVVPPEGPAREANGWQRVASAPIADVAASGQRVWVRTRAGALVRSDDGGESWRLLAPAGVMAMALGDGGTPLFVETASAAGGAGQGADLVVTQGDARTPWGAALPALPPGGAWTLRARADVIAVCAFGPGAFRARAGGAWERVEGTSNATAVALIDDAGTALVALHSAAEDRAWIARAGADNVARIVAEIGGDADEGEDPRVLDLAWDDREKLAWAAGPFGIAVLRSR